MHRLPSPKGSTAGHCVHVWKGWHDTGIRVSARVARARSHATGEWLGGGPQLRTPALFSTMSTHTSATKASAALPVHSSAAHGLGDAMKDVALDEATAGTKHECDPVLAQTGVSKPHFEAEGFVVLDQLINNKFVGELNRFV